MEFSNFKKSNTRATEDEIQQLKKELDKVYHAADGVASSCSVDELYELTNKCFTIKATNIRIPFKSLKKEIRFNGTFGIEIDQKNLTYKLVCATRLPRKKKKLIKKAIGI
jgi:hypothetical protein